jgi:antitoxin component of MazEF toxin-antitoxin module
MAKSLIQMLFKRKQGRKAPIRRKICRIGNSRAIFLPSGWLEDIEEKHGIINAVTIEVNGILKVRPVIKEAERE